MKGIYRFTKRKKLPPMWTDDPVRDAEEYDEYLEHQDDVNIEDDIADQMFNERYNR